MDIRIEDLNKIENLTFKFNDNLTLVLKVNDGILSIDTVNHSELKTITEERKKHFNEIMNKADELDKKYKNNYNEFIANFICKYMDKHEKKKVVSNIK